MRIECGPAKIPTTFRSSKLPTAGSLAIEYSQRPERIPAARFANGLELEECPAAMFIRGASVRWTSSPLQKQKRIFEPGIVLRTGI